MRSTRALTQPLALLALVTGACGGSPQEYGSGTTPHARVDGPPSGSSNDNIVPAASSAAVEAEPAGAAGREARDTVGQLLVSGPGFTPPTLQASGVAGGAVDGHSGPMACTGSYPDRPQHVLKISRRIPMLRVMADGIDRDLTLALRTPDGQWLCNDDSGDPGYGLNPAVDLAGASGEIEVYVGVFSDDVTGAQYTLGVTEDLSRYGSSMRSGGVGLPPPGFGGPIMK